jgi:hypothetical protein
MMEMLLTHDTVLPKGIIWKYGTETVECISFHDMMLNGAKNVNNVDIF